MQNEPTVRMTAVRRLYEVSARMGAGRSLAETLQAVVDGVVDGLGFGIAVLNLRLPDGKFEVISVAGSHEAKEALLGTVSAADIFDAEFDIADKWGALRFVPHERLPEGDVVGWVPEIPVSTEPDAWHPLDALFAPLHSSDGELVGMLSVDLPEDQRRPGQIHRELLEIFATQAGLAIDKARLTDQLLAEKARLEASETTFRLVFEGAGNGMATVAFDGPDRGSRTAGQRRLLPHHRLHPGAAGRDDPGRLSARGGHRADAARDRAAHHRARALPVRAGLPADGRERHLARRHRGDR